LVLLLALVLTACWSGGGKNEDQWGSFDAGSDSDTDIDTDADGDGDLDTDAACLFDSAFPCSCHKSTDECDDGSECVWTMTFDNGFCTPACQDAADAGPCPDAGGFGLASECLWFLGDGEVPTNCGLICQDGTASGDCPPGQFCMINDDGDYGICAPDGYEL